MILKIAFLSYWKFKHFDVAVQLLCLRYIVFTLGGVSEFINRIKDAEINMIKIDHMIKVRLSIPFHEKYQISGHQSDAQLLEK